MMHAHTVTPVRTDCHAWPELVERVVVLLAMTFPSPGFAGDNRRPDPLRQDAFEEPQHVATGYLLDLDRRKPRARERIPQVRQLARIFQAPGP